MAFATWVTCCHVVQIDQAGGRSQEVAVAKKVRGNPGDNRPEGFAIEHICSWNLHSDLEQIL